MKGYLIDINILSEIRKGAQANAGVQTWFNDTEDDHLYLSSLVIGEIRRGVELVRRKDSMQAQKLEAWLMYIKESFAERMLGINNEICEIWGGFGLQEPVPPIDGLLAATALFHNLTLVTRNIKDVQRTPTTILNPFSE
jgi:toxin FitB